MPLDLQALPASWVRARRPDGTVEAELPDGTRLVTHELVPMPIPEEAAVWLAGLAREIMEGEATLEKVAFASARGWTVDAIEARVGTRTATLLIYRFWSWAGIAVVRAPLASLPEAAREVLASGRPDFTGTVRHLAELWT